MQGSPTAEKPALLSVLKHREQTHQTSPKAGDKKRLSGCKDSDTQRPRSYCARLKKSWLTLPSPVTWNDQQNRARPGSAGKTNSCPWQRAARRSKMAAALLPAGLAPPHRAAMVRCPLGKGRSVPLTLDVVSRSPCSHSSGLLALLQQQGSFLAMLQSSLQHILGE